MKKDVLITIRGNQRSDDDSDTIELTTVGTYEPYRDGYRIAYAESEMTGMAGVTTEIKTFEDYVVMNRSGAFTSQMVFESGKRHLCRYATPAGQIQMAVTTAAIRNSLRENGGSLSMHYDLDVDNRPVSGNDFYITVKEQVTNYAHE